jgi:hypothetical protein
MDYCPTCSGNHGSVRSPSQQVSHILCTSHKYVKILHIIIRLIDRRHVVQRDKLYSSIQLFKERGRRWEDNVKTCLKETGRESVEYFHLPQDRNKWQTFVTMVMNLRVQYKAENFFS